MEQGEAGNDKNKDGIGQGSALKRKKANDDSSVTTADEDGEDTLVGKIKGAGSKSHASSDISSTTTDNDNNDDDDDDDDDKDNNIEEEARLGKNSPRKAARMEALTTAETVEVQNEKKKRKGSTREKEVDSDDSMTSDMSLLPVRSQSDASEHSTPPHKDLLFDQTGMPRLEVAGAVTSEQTETTWTYRLPSIRIFSIGEEGVPQGCDPEAAVWRGKTKTNKEETDNSDAEADGEEPDYVGEGMDGVDKPSLANILSWRHGCIPVQYVKTSKDSRIKPQERRLPRFMKSHPNLNNELDYFTSLRTRGDKEYSRTARKTYQARCMSKCLTATKTQKHPRSPFELLHRIEGIGFSGAVVQGGKIPGFVKYRECRSKNRCMCKSEFLCVANGLHDLQYTIAGRDVPRGLSHTDLVPVFRNFDKIAEVLKVARFERYHDQESNWKNPDWRCPRWDKTLCCLASDTIVGVFIGGIYFHRFYLVGYPMQGTFANGSRGFMPGIEPICDGLINFLLSKRSGHYEKKETRAYRFLHTSVRATNPSTWKLLSRSRHGNQHSVAMYNHYHVRESLVRNRLLEMITKRIVEKRDEYKTRPGFPSSFPYTLQMLMKDWIVASVVKDTISFPVGEKIFWVICQPIFRLFGKSHKGTAKPSMPDQHTFYIAHHQAIMDRPYELEQNIVMSLDKERCFKAPTDTTMTLDLGEPYRDNTYIDPATEDTRKWLEHEMNLMAVEVSIKDLSVLENMAVSQIQAVPHDFGDPSKFFGREMEQYSPACPTLKFCRAFPAGLESKNKCGLLRLFGVDNPTEHNKSQRTSVLAILAWAVDLVMKGIGDSRETDENMDPDEFDIYDVAEYRHGTFDTDIKIVNGCHLSLRPSFCYQVKRMGGVIAFVEFPLSRFGMVGRYFKDINDKLGKMVHVPRGSALVGPLTLIRETGYLTHVGGNRHVHLSIICIPKGKVSQEVMLGHSCLLKKAFCRSYPHLDKTILSLESGDYHNEDGELKPQTEKHLKLVHVLEYPEEDQRDKKKKKKPRKKGPPVKDGEGELAGHRFKILLPEYQNEDFKNIMSCFA